MEPQLTAPFTGGSGQGGRGRGSLSLIRGRRREAPSEAAADKDQLRAQPPLTHRCLPLKIQRAKRTNRGRQTHAGRALPDVHLPDTSPGPWRGRGRVRRPAGSVPRAVPGAAGARAAPGGRVASGRGEARPGRERSAAPRKGSGAAFSPADGSVKWRQLEDGASFGRAPGPSLRRRRRARRARLAGPRPAPARLGAAGGGRGALGSWRARRGPLASPGRGAQSGPQAPVGGRGGAGGPPPPGSLHGAAASLRESHPAPKFEAGRSEPVTSLPRPPTPPHLSHLGGYLSWALPR